MAGIVNLASLLHDATQAGDIAGLRRALGDPPGFPNSALPWEAACGDTLLVYALLWGPFGLVRELLSLRADPDAVADDGYPALHAALLHRPERLERVALLLAHGADPDQRGLRDFTALHRAASLDDAEAIRLLLRAGADPSARAGIRETPLALARRLGHDRAVAALTGSRLAGPGGAALATVA